MNRFNIIVYDKIAPSFSRQHNSRWIWRLSAFRDSLHPACARHRTQLLTKTESIEIKNEIHHPNREFVKWFSASMWNVNQPMRCRSTRAFKFNNFIVEIQLLSGQLVVPVATKINRSENGCVFLRQSNFAMFRIKAFCVRRTCVCVC